MAVKVPALWEALTPQQKQQYLGMGWTLAEGGLPVIGAVVLIIVGWLTALIPTYLLYRKAVKSVVSRQAEHRAALEKRMQQTIEDLRASYNLDPGVTLASYLLGIGYVSDGQPTILWGELLDEFSAHFIEGTTPGEIANQCSYKLFGDAGALPQPMTTVKAIFGCLESAKLITVVSSSRGSDPLNPYEEEYDVPDTYDYKFTDKGLELAPVLRRHRKNLAAEKLKAHP